MRHGHGVGRRFFLEKRDRGLTFPLKFVFCVIVTT
jgi:hypothetical protein